MKKKGLTYIMLIAVLAIWGKLIFDFVNAGNDQIEEFSSQFTSAPTESAKIDSVYAYKLDLDYRDPFLGKSPERKPTGLPKKKVVREKTPVKEFIVNWPNVAYLGMMQNNQSGQKLAMLKLNTVDLVLAEGDSLGKGFVLGEILRDSLILSFKETSKTIYK